MKLYENPYFYQHDFNNICEKIYDSQAVSRSKNFLNVSSKKFDYGVFKVGELILLATFSVGNAEEMEEKNQWIILEKAVIKIGAS